MQSTTAHLESNKPAAVLGLLRSFGIDTADFDVEESEGAGVANILGLDGGLITVRCRMTGEERLYATGPGSAWFGALFMDLGWGHFRTSPAAVNA